MPARAKKSPKQARKTPAVSGERDKPVATDQPGSLSPRVREGLFLFVCFIAAYLFAALISYHPADPAWVSSGGGQAGGAIHNWGGRVGAWLADVLLFLFGYVAWLFPILMPVAGWQIMRADAAETVGHPARHNAIRALGMLMALIGGCTLAALHFNVAEGALPINSAGGILGDVLGRFFWQQLDLLGVTLLMLAVFLAGITLFTGLSWLGLMDTVGRWIYNGFGRLRETMHKVEEHKLARTAQQQRATKLKTEKKRKEDKPAPRIEPKVRKVEIGKRAVKEKQVPLFDTIEPGELPPLSLLDPPAPHGRGYSKEELEAMAQQVESKLRDFGVDVEVVSVHTGPVITRFELNPAPGVKGSQIANLAKDLARSLSTVSVRVVEVIPGKPYVGLEVPNQEREMVSLSEVFQSKVYEDSKSPLTIALGKDIAGQPDVADLQKMPHLLVAGTTGAGKSVALNVMLLSLLYKAQPQDVRMILIDPKMLELSVYDGIPHLLTPVVTDMKDAANALRWCVGEMERRYKLMSALGVRNLAGYNKKVSQAIADGEPIKDPLFEPPSSAVFDPDAEPPEIPTLEPIPFVVVVVDELADLMLIVGKKVEELILRLAQKARAAGVHLVLATQRPSVDVITGLIRANIPARIAFQVATKVDSRTILDQGGAETLLGKGDMLYLPMTSPMPTRIHGAFVDDHEVHKVVAHLKQTGTPNYLEEIVRDPEEGGALLPGETGGDFGDGGDAEQEPFYDEAVKMVTESRRISASSIQRRFRIGYNRAARIVEAMEAAGVVSALQPNGQREVLAPPPVE